MGLYGSPDTGNLYSGKDGNFTPKKKPFYKKVIFWILIALNIFLLVGLEPSEENVLMILSLNCVVIFTYSIIKIIYNSVKKNGVKRNIITAVICFVLFFIFSMTYANYDDENAIKQNPQETNSVESIPQETKGARKNPAKIGETVQTDVIFPDGLKCTIEIELVEFKRENEAVEIIQAGGSSGNNPGEGKEFALAKFRVKNLKNSSDKDVPFSLTNTNFSYSTGEYKVIDSRWDVPGLNPSIEADLYEGAENEGWICFSIEKDDTAPKVVFLNEIWFDL